MKRELRGKVGGSLLALKVLLEAMVDIGYSDSLIMSGHDGAQYIESIVGSILTLNLVHSGLTFGLSLSCYKEVSQTWLSLILREQQSYPMPFRVPLRFEFSQVLPSVVLLPQYTSI